MDRTPIRIVLYLFLIVLAVGAASAAKIALLDPIKVPSGEPLKAIYFFPHWWDPWKSDDAAVTSDLQKMKELGFNTICVDHEVSQAIDRDWYWLDREFRLAGAQGMYILPWLQLQGLDRTSLMKFSHLELMQAVNQDGQPQDECVVYRDENFRKALAHYISVYLDRYADNPALLKVTEGRRVRPVVGLMLEVGWRDVRGLPLSFDDDTNEYFRKWMKATYHDLAHLNKKWGTSYKSFDEIDPRDKTIFDYAFSDKRNMPVAVQEHARFRARLINDALSSVVQQVRKKHKNVLFVVEVAFPFSLDDPIALAYRWNNANEPKAVESADIVMIRSAGNTCAGQVEKDQKTLSLSGKRIITAYRFFAGSDSARAVAYAIDGAVTANAIACYNWNETADETSSVYNKPDFQSLAKLMLATYDSLFDADKRHQLAPLMSIPVPVSNPATEPAPSETPTGPAEPDSSPGETSGNIPAAEGAPGGGSVPPAPVAPPLPAETAN